jgi:hypothetical protein
MLNKIIIGIALSGCAIGVLRWLMLQKIIPLPRQLRILIGGAILASAIGANAKTDSLDRTPEWKTVDSAWRHPTKENVLKAVRALDTLTKRGALLKEEASQLHGMMSGKVPPEPPSPEVTCYEPMPSPEVMAASRLEARLPVLEKMVLEETLHPAVWKKLLQTVRDDVAAMKDFGTKEADALKKRKNQLNRRAEALIKAAEKRLAQERKRK